MVHNIAFQQLPNYLNQLLEGRALEIAQLLKKIQCYLQENNYENFDWQTTQKLKKRLLQHYGSSIIVTNSINTTQIQR